MMWTTVAHIMTGVMGAGVLSLGWSLPQLGWLFGPFAVAIFALVTGISTSILSYCYRSRSSEHGPHSYGRYFTFIQGWVYVGLLYLKRFTTKQMVNPWKTYVKMSAILMGSHGLTRGSLAYYPAQLMLKSTKIG